MGALCEKPPKETEEEFNKRFDKFLEDKASGFSNAIVSKPAQARNIVHLAVKDKFDIRQLHGALAPGFALSEFRQWLATKDETSTRLGKSVIQSINGRLPEARSLLARGQRWKASILDFIH